MKTVETERWRESFPEFKEKTEAFLPETWTKRSTRGFPENTETMHRGTARR